MAKKHNDGYLSAKESRRISKENRKITNALEKKRKRKNVPESEYLTEMHDPNNAVEFDNLHTYFFTDTGVVKSVDGVTFSVPIGKTVGVVGESGCGKSVTSLSLMQLLRGNYISMIFQEPMTALNPVFRIGDQVDEVLALHNEKGHDEAQIKARTIELLEMVGIANSEGVYKMFPHELSGGMRQRVMIAMALACNPKILIADEPTTALDVTIQAQIMRLLKQLQEKMGTSIILITHDLGIVAQIAKHVMVMYCGQAVEYSDVRSIYKNPLHPYTAGLLRSIPKLTDDDMEELPSIPGMVPSPSEKLQGCRFAPRCEKCGARCKKEMPDLVTLEDGRKVRCFLYEGGVEG